MVKLFRILIVLSVLIPILVLFLLFRTKKAGIQESLSMFPTIPQNAKVFYSASSKSIEQISFGDLIVFKPPEPMPGLFCMRVMGLPDDILKIQDNRFYRNGEVYHYPSNPKGFFSETNYVVESPYRVPANSVFVLGDNFFEANDSRYWRALPKERIVGKVLSISVDNEHLPKPWQQE